MQPGRCGCSLHIGSAVTCRCSLGNALRDARLQALGDAYIANPNPSPNPTPTPNPNPSPNPNPTPNQVLAALGVRDAARLSLASDGAAVALGSGAGCDAGGGDGLYAWGNAVHQALGVAEVSHCSH